MNVTVAVYQAYVKGYLSVIYRDGSRRPVYRNPTTKEAYENGVKSGTTALTLFTKNFHRSQKSLQSGDHI